MPKVPKFIVQHIPLIDLTSDSDEDPSEDHTPEQHPPVSDDDTPQYSPADHSEDPEEEDAAINSPPSPVAPVIPATAAPPTRPRPYWRGNLLVTARKTTRLPRRRVLAQRDLPQDTSTHEIGESSRQAETRAFVTRDEFEKAMAAIRKVLDCRGEQPEVVDIPCDSMDTAAGVTMTTPVGMTVRGWYIAAAAMAVISVIVAAMIFYYY